MYSFADGIITLPVAIFGFLYFPDTPSTTTSKYLSESEKALAVSRIPRIKADGHNVRPIALMKRLFLNPILSVYQLLPQ
jgi:MFS transporter, ACS family, pantothenate transporter